MATIRDGERDRQHLETLKSTHLYLRLSMVGVVAAIFLAIAFTPAGFKPENTDFLRSISHYYYTPARIIFTAALCAAALALIALTGRGVQNYLLDLAAVLAPLIAVVPTRVFPREVGPDAELGSCVAGWPAGSECIPANQLAYVGVGFGVWICFAVAGMVFALIRGVYSFTRPREQWESPWYWIVLVVAVVFVVIYAVWWFSPGSEGLQKWGHITAAGTFFCLIALVAVIEAFRQMFGQNTRTPAFFSRRVYAVVYAVLAVVLVADMVIAVVVLIRASTTDVGNAVFVIEVVGLVAFALFWVVQTVEHLRDADGWESPTPPSTWSASNSSAPASLQQDLAIAGYYTGQIDGVIGDKTRSAVTALQAECALPFEAVTDEAGSVNKQTAAALRAELAV